jgi:NAD(P)-dependent dehydrogenase (short-subunit alcohol dehydrogenase family)
VAITGAAGGLGTALARAFDQAGARLALLDLEAPRALADELGGGALALSCDVTEPAACAAAVEAVVDRLGRLDVLVNNAGITHRSPFASTDVEVLRRVMDVNFFGAVHATRAALQPLQASAGLVVAVSSVAGFAPLLGRTGYAASKHALEGFMGTLRGEVAGSGLDVLVVRPGFLDTPLTRRALGPDGQRVTHAQRAVGSRMHPDQAAQAIVRAAARRQRELVLTPVARASWWLTRLVPRLYESLMRRTQRSELATSPVGAGFTPALAPGRRVATEGRG